MPTKYFPINARISSLGIETMMLLLLLIIISRGDAASSRTPFVNCQAVVSHEQLLRKRAMPVLGYLLIFPQVYSKLVFEPTLNDHV